MNKTQILQTASKGTQKQHKQLHKSTSEPKQLYNKMPAVGKYKRALRLQTVPGPGSYYLQTTFNKKKGITIVSRTRPLKNLQSKPDPWSYIPNSKFVLPKSPNATIGRQCKVQRFKNAPGPSDYRVNFNYLASRSKMPVIGTSRKDETIELKPGPTDYDTLGSDKALRKNIPSSIGHSTRPKSTMQDFPGPSQYKIDDQFTINRKTKIGFTMASKIRSKTVCQSPTNYLKYNADKINIMNKSPAFTIKKQQSRPLTINLSPGPAAYSPPSKDREGITIPRSLRPCPSSESSTFLLYDISKVDKGVTYSIPRSDSKPRQSINKSPGPSDYSPEAVATQKYKQIGIGMGQRSNFDASNITPGPGKYKISSDSPRRAYTIGHSGRGQQRQKMMVPGPGKYIIDYDAIRKYVSSKKK